MEVEGEEAKKPVKDEYKLIIQEEDDTKTELIFQPNILRYFEALNTQYTEQGYREGNEWDKLHLDGTLWQFIYDVYVEHDAFFTDKEKPSTAEEALKRPIRSTALTKRIELLPFAELYQILRIVDYYLAPLMVTFVMHEIIRRLLITPIENLALLHPKVRLPSVEEAANAIVANTEKINKPWGIRLQMIRAIIERYVATDGLLIMFKAALPHLPRVMATGNEFLMVITPDGLYSYGKNQHYQRGLIASQGGSIQNDKQSYQRLIDEMSSLLLRKQQLLQEQQQLVLQQRQIRDGQQQLQQQQSMQQQQQQLVGPNWQQQLYQQQQQLQQQMLQQQQQRLYQQQQLVGPYGQQQLQVPNSSFGVTVTSQLEIDTLSTLITELTKKRDEVEQRFLKVLNPPLVIVSIACGSTFAMILTTTGLFALGDNRVGQLGQGYQTPNSASLVQVPLRGIVVDVWCGPNHTIVMMDSGELAIWGQSYTHTASETSVTMNKPTQLKRPRGEIIDIACNVNMTILLMKDGTLLSYDKKGLSYIRFIEKFKAIATGFGAGGHFLLLSETNRVYALGANDYGQLGRGDTAFIIDQISAVKFTAEHTIKQVFAAFKASYFVTDTGLLFTCGLNGSGRLGLSTTTLTITTPQQVKLYIPPIISICGTELSTFCLTVDGLYTFKTDRQGMSYIEKIILPFTDLPLSIEEAPQTDSNKKAKFSCYFCGSAQFSELGLQTYSNRLFCCKTNDCKSQYSDWTL